MRSGGKTDTTPGALPVALERLTRYTLPRIVSALVAKYAEDCLLYRYYCCILTKPVGKQRLPRASFIIQDKLARSSVASTIRSVV